ncbi:MAG: phosphoglycolate phosphatase [Aeromonadaceae bacterium]
MRAKRSQFDLLLFDLDGTLIDSVPQLFLAVDAALRSCGLPGVTQEQVQKWIGNGADILLKRAMQRSYELEGEVDAELFKRVRSAFDAHYHASLASNFALFPGVVATLSRLRHAGYRMAVVTNKPAPFVEPLMRAADLLPLFDMSLGGDVLPVRKPDPAPLLHICEALQIAPARTLMIGDSRNDVLAAQAAAIPVVGLTYGYNHGEPIASSDPDWVMDEFSQLEELLLVN